MRRHNRLGSVMLPSVDYIWLDCYGLVVIEF